MKIRQLFAVLVLCSALAVAQGRLGGNGKIGGSGVIGAAAAAGSPLAQTAWGCIGISATTSTCTATSGFSATAGDPVIAYEYFVASTGTTAAPTGCASSWTLVVNDTTNGQSTYIGSVTSTGSCAISFGATFATANQAAYYAVELKSAVASTTVDTYSVTGEQFCTTCLMTSITTTVANDVAVSFWFVYTGTLTMTGTFTADNILLPAVVGGQQSFDAYQVVATASTVHTSFTAGTLGYGPGITVAVKP